MFLFYTSESRKVLISVAIPGSRAGVVQGRKEGKWVHYSIDPAGAERARQLLAQQLTLLPFPEKGGGCCCEE